MYGFSMIKPMHFSTVGADSSLGDEYPEVQISSGLIKGIKMASFWTNQTFYAFRGVPYAAPPIGDLRFKGDHLKGSVIDCLQKKRNL